MLQSFQNCFKIPELRTRILFTLGLLIVYRIGGQITVPGVEVRVVQERLAQQDVAGFRLGVVRRGETNHLNSKFRHLHT